MRDLNQLRLTRTSRCPYYASLTYHVTYTVQGGALNVEGECARCYTGGQAFRYQPVAHSEDLRTRVQTVEV